MSYPHYNSNSGTRTSRRTTVEFGRTYVVRPKGRHQATIVWLHGLGDNGASWSQLLESLPLPNIKWICPTAPVRPVTLLGGFPCTALLYYNFFGPNLAYEEIQRTPKAKTLNSGFNVSELSEDGPEDSEGLDASAAHVANLLSAEPPDVKVGIGGFSIGAATATYSATCWALGKYGNGNPYPINIRAVIGLSGWLPGSRTLRNKIEGFSDAVRRAAILPIFLYHGTCDEIVPYTYGERSARYLSLAGFRYLTFKSCDGIGHYTVPREMADVCSWISLKLGLEGSRT